MRTDKYTVSKLADMAGDIALCERNMRLELEKAAKTIIENKYKLVLIAGPSCSCKTSSTLAIDALLEATGLGSTEISMDDYYLNRDECPIMENGEPDIESPAAYDMKLLNEQLTELASGRPVDMPLFDFPTAMRKKETKRMTPEKNGVIILEGINALNPVIATEIAPEKVCRIFVCPMAEVVGGDRQLLAARDIRFIRRIVRDKFFRGNGVTKTMQMWPSVGAAETEFIFPYVGNADIRINTFHPYELSLFKREMLGCIPEECGDYADMFSNIKQVMSGLPEISVSELESSSLLHEFIK